MGHRTQLVDVRQWLLKQMGFIFDESSKFFIHVETGVEFPREVIDNALVLAGPDEIRNMIADSVSKARQRNW